MSEFVEIVEAAKWAAAPFISALDRFRERHGREATEVLILTPAEQNVLSLSLMTVGSGRLFAREVQEMVVDRYWTGVGINLAGQRVQVENAICAGVWANMWVMVK